MPKKFEDMKIGDWFVPNLAMMTEDGVLEKRSATEAVEITDWLGKQSKGRTFKIEPSATFDLLIDP